MSASFGMREIWLVAESGQDIKTSNTVSAFALETSARNYAMQCTRRDVHFCVYRCELVATAELSGPTFKEERAAD